MSERHLWEVDHPYYCNNGNYFDNNCYTEYETWSNFNEEFGNSDIDYNLVFRFDWKEGEDHDAEAYNGNDSYRNGFLDIYILGQRKGLFTAHRVFICRADEPSVIEFLKPRLERIKQLWEPLL